MKFFKNKKYFPVNRAEKDAPFYYGPYSLLLLWALFSIVSIFFIPFKILFNPFIIFSILIRFLIVCLSLYFFKKIFIEEKVNKRFYRVLKTFVGYGVVFTYVFYSFPIVIGDFYQILTDSFSMYYFILIIIVTAFPTVLYIFLRLDKTKLITKAYSPAELKHEKSLKKDKQLRLKEKKKLQKERSFIEKLWYNWIDDFLQAILTVMVINQFIFQMYQIPSESMVPTFLIKDRVVVNKMIYGPQIPLTKWKLPSPFKPEVGDIVVFLNPETFTEGSDVAYNNVFSRVFFPFVYMMTLSMVDIDKKANGDPKERFIVKRLVAKEGEKLCILNDKVYKKTKDSDWTLMSNIKDQDEYGHAELFYNDNPDMRVQSVNKPLRELYDKVVEKVESRTFSQLEKDLQESKENFIESLNELGIETFVTEITNAATTFESNNNTRRLEFGKENLLFSMINWDELHIIPSLNVSEKKSKEQSVADKLKGYNYCVNYDMLINLINELKIDDYFENEVNSSIVVSSDISPYKSFMKKLNAQYKISRLNLYDNMIAAYLDGSLTKYLENQTTENQDLLNALNDFYILEIYLNGVPSYEEAINFQGEKVSYAELESRFDRMNFPEYPAGKEQYLPDESYFLLGDNRYNSHDFRYGGRYISGHNMPIDSDDFGAFTAKVREVKWAPRTLDSKFILGKAGFIFFPFDRVRVLK